MHFVNYTPVINDIITKKRKKAARHKDALPFIHLQHFKHLLINRLRQRIAV